ncbi:hypothetical protein AMTRI_Chr04g186360 [Amborella trichopoda]
MQSPIDIIHGNAIYDHSLKSLKARYEPAQAKLPNSGHGIGLGWEKGSAGGIHINGTQFVLGEFHWHSPYEHTLDGYWSALPQYDLEMQMVHCSADGRIAVVAVIDKVGLQDHFLLKVKTISMAQLGKLRAAVEERIAMDLCRPTLCCTSSFTLFLIITQSVPSAPQKVGNLCHPFSLFLYILQFLFSLFFPDEKEFDYLEGSAKGPKHWGELHPEWKACSNGNMQSPIDLLQGRAEVLPNLRRLKREYKPAEAILMNKGHVIMLGWEKGSAGGIHINGTQFVLGEFHWHSPYEHTLDGYCADGRIAVVAVIYKVGLQDHFLLKVKTISMAQLGKLRAAVEEVRYFI